MLKTGHGPASRRRRQGRPARAGPAPRDCGQPDPQDTAAARARARRGNPPRRQRASAVSFPFGAAAHHAPLRRERPAPISSSGSSAKPGLASQCDPHRANRRDRDSGRNVDLHVVLIEWHLSGAHQRLQHCTQDAYPPNPPSDRSVAACRDDAARSSASAPDPLALHRSRSPLPPVHRPVALTRQSPKLVFLHQLGSSLANSRDPAICIVQ